MIENVLLGPGTPYKTNNKKQKQRTDRNPIRGRGVVTKLHKCPLGTQPCDRNSGEPGPACPAVVCRRLLLSAGPRCGAERRIPSFVRRILVNANKAFYCEYAHFILCAPSRRPLLSLSSVCDPGHSTKSLETYVT